MPGVNTPSAAVLIDMSIAVGLYLLTYLTFVRILRFPRNWVTPGPMTWMPTVVLTIALAVHVSLSSDGLDHAALLVVTAFIGLLFYIIAAPAIAFKPGTRAIEFLARHGNHAGLWMLVPAVVAGYAVPNDKLQAVLVVALVVELVWFVRRRLNDRRGRLYPIEGPDLAVMKIQADGDLASFASLHGVDELEVSGDGVDWRGCSRASCPCPLNLYVNRLGLNTAPCCRERMEELCHAVCKWLEDLKTVYWLEGGTLLGAVRENGKLLPWEDDVDVSVMVDDDHAWRVLVTGVVERARRDGYLVDVFEREGFIAISHASPVPAPWQWERYRLRGEVRLDLTAYRPSLSRGQSVLERRTHKGAMPATDNGGFGVASTLVLPTSTIPFLGRELGCPGRAEAYLAVLYGDFNQVEYSYVDAGPAAARHGHDANAPTSPS